MSDNQRIWDQLDPDWLTTKYHRDGLTIRQIAELKGVSVSTVHTAMTRYNIPRREPLIFSTPLNGPALWRKYWLLGMNISQISKQTSRDCSSIHRALNKHGIPRRPRGEQWNGLLPSGTLYVYIFQNHPIYLRLGFNGRPPCQRLYDEVIEIPVVARGERPAVAGVRRVHLVADWLSDLVEEDPGYA